MPNAPLRMYLVSYRLPGKGEVAFDPARGEYRKDLWLQNFLSCYRREDVKYFIKKAFPQSDRIEITCLGAMSADPDLNYYAT